MKLIIAILNADDSKTTIEALNKNKYFVTKLSSSGGFLKKRNTTILIGTDEDKIEKAVSIIKENSGLRQETVYSTPTMNEADMCPGSEVVIPMDVQVGGATIFVVDVADFQKL